MDRTPLPATTTVVPASAPPRVPPSRCVMCQRRCCPVFSLPCHAICTSCLNLLVRHRDPSDVVLCPQCSRIYVFTEEWKRHLRLEFRNDLWLCPSDTDVIRCQRCSLRRARRGGGGGGGVGRPNTPVPYAEQYCCQCLQALCHQCHRELHIYYTTSRPVGPDPLHHIVVPLLPADWVMWCQEGVTNCFKHDQMTLFCVTCSAPLCPTCHRDSELSQQANGDSDWDNHWGHEVWDVGSSLENARNFLLSRLTAMEAHRLVLRRLATWISSLLQGNGEDRRNTSPDHATSFDKATVAAAFAERRKKKEKLSRGRLWRTKSAGTDGATTPNTQPDAESTHNITIQNGASSSSTRDFALSVWPTGRKPPAQRDSLSTGSSTEQQKFRCALQDTNSTAQSTEMTLAEAMSRLSLVTHYFPANLATESSQQTDGMTNSIAAGSDSSSVSSSEETVSLSQGQGPCALRQLGRTAAQERHQALSTTQMRPDHTEVSLAHETQDQQTVGKDELPTETTPFSQTECRPLSDDASQSADKDGIFDPRAYSNRRAHGDELVRLVKTMFPGDSLNKHFRALQTSCDTLDCRAVRLRYELFNMDMVSLCCVRVWINARSVISEQAYNVLNQFSQKSHPPPNTSSPAYASGKGFSHQSGASSGPPGSAEGSYERSSSVNILASDSTSTPNLQNTFPNGIQPDSFIFPSSGGYS